MVATIILPLDTSELAEQAAPWARALAARNQAAILLVSAVELPVEFATWAGSGLVGATDAIQRSVDERRAYLARVAHTFGDARVQTLAEIGRAVSVIADAATAAPDPLLVMASHGRSGIKRAVMGSVAERALRMARCPVMLIRAHDDGDRPPAQVGFGKVLVPLDGSAFAEQALDQALAALGPGELALHLVRVVELPVLHPIGADDVSLSMNYGLIAEYVDATRQEAGDYLNRVGARLAQQGRQVTWETREGQVADELHRAADEQRVDLIAMATHGRGGFSRLVFGSTAESLLRRADRPLLLVRPSENDED